MNSNAKNTNYVVLSLLVVSLLLTPLIVAVTLESSSNSILAFNTLSSSTSSTTSSTTSNTNSVSAPVSAPSNSVCVPNSVSVSNSDSAPSNSDSAPSLGLANGVINVISVGHNSAPSNPFSKTPNTVRVPLHNANEEQPHGTPFFCSISPVYKKLAVTEQTFFQLQCFSMLGTADPIPCPSEIQLYSDAGTPTLADFQSVYTRVINFVAGSKTLNGGVLRATMIYPDTADTAYPNKSFSCQANVDVYTKAESCVLQPQTATLAVGEQKQFSVTCYGANILIPVYGIADGYSAGNGGAAPQVPCPDFVWTSDAGTLSGGSSAGTTLTAVNEGAGKYVEARYVELSSIPEEGFFCRAAVNVTPAVSTPTPSPTPTSTPIPTLSQGGGGGGTNILLPYTGYNYVDNRASPTPTQAPAAPSPSPSPRPTMGHIVLIPVTATPTPTAVAAAGASGLTGLFTAQLAPLALGLLLGVIAIVLLWYWLAGDKKNAANKNAAKKEAKSEAKK